MTAARPLMAIYFCSNGKLMSFCQVMIENFFSGFSSIFVEQFSDSRMKEKSNFKPELSRMKPLRS